MQRSALLIYPWDYVHLDITTIGSMGISWVSAGLRVIQNGHVSLIFSLLG